jgi:hypothetical protein
MEVHKLAMLGASAKEIGLRLGVSHDTITRRFRAEMESGLAEGVLAAKAKIYRKGVLNGEFASLQLFLVNTAGWTIRPDVSVVTNVIQARFTQAASGGLVAGSETTISSAATSVSGGWVNTASGVYSSVLGGIGNTAEAGPPRAGSSVAGGARLHPELRNS